MQVKNLHKLPKEISGLINKIGMACDKKGIKAYVVGGFVRDIYLGLANYDLDIVIESDAISFAKSSLGELGAHLICHSRFGTATISTFERHKLDIATARKEIYEQPAALPKVSPSGIFEDLKRRDFTINTLAFSINKNNFGALLDYFGGLDDLKDKKIKVLHNLSFIDDPTRILRAIRFEIRFKFKIEPQTMRLLKKSLKLNMLEKTQKHRTRDEIILLLKENNPIGCIKRLQALGGLNFICSKIKVDYKLLNSIKSQIKWFHEKSPRKRALDVWVLYFIGLIDKVNFDDINYILRNFAFGRGDTKRIRDYKLHINDLIEKISKANLTPSQVYNILEPLPYELILMIKAKTHAYRQAGHNKIIDKHICDFFNIYNGKRLYISGKDLKSIGLVPGPHFKDILKKTLCAKLDGKLLSKEDELEYLMAYAKRFN